MAKVSIQLSESEKRKSGEAPLYLACRHRDARAKLSLGMTVKPKDWHDRTGEVRKTHPHHRRLNRHLKRTLADAEEELAALVLDGPARGERVTAARIRDRVQARLNGDEAAAGEEAPLDFLGYADEVVDGYRQRGQFGTWEVYVAALNKLKAFYERETGRDVLPFEDVTPRLLRRFHAYLLAPKSEGGVGNNENTAHKAFMSLGRFYRQALQEGLAPFGPDPFRAVKVKKVPVQKEKLTIDEVRTLAHADLGPEDGLLNRVREWWMFAFYAGGMRFSDVATLRRRHLVMSVDDDGDEEVRVRYRMKKTKDLHAVLLVPEAVAILDRRGWREKDSDERVFEVLDGYDLTTPRSRHSAIGSRNALANKYLNKAAKRAGIVDQTGKPKRIGFHLARHSLAGYLLEQGADVHTIKEVLAHATVKQSEEYIKGFARSTADDVMREIKL